MKLFGTVESFDENKGQGLIKPEEVGKSAIAFEKSAISGENKAPPPVGKRLSYELSETNGETRAVNLQNA
jgi:cold shock CspA family protein